MIMSTKKWEALSKEAMDQHHEAFERLLGALWRYRHPRGALSGQHVKDAALMVPFLEVLLDQLYPREIWERVLNDATPVVSTGKRKHPIQILPPF